MYGIFSTPDTPPRAGYRLTDGQILDLVVAQNLDLFRGIPLPNGIFDRSTLNRYIALGRPVWRAVQQRIAYHLTAPQGEFWAFRELLVLPADLPVTLHLPIRVGDYTDFYAGIHHAENVGRMFRPDGDALLPNYRHLPVGYHGRASSIVVTDTPFRRPQGQFLQDGQPVFGPSRALDFELELGLIIGAENPLGQPVPVSEAEDYIFGVVLFNDWSARDIQRWEYQPLGPFLGKNFGSSMSAWIAPFDALEPFRVAGPVQEPQPLPYLHYPQPAHFDLPLNVDLNGRTISRSNARHLYWSFAQLIAHHTVGGCNLRVGDVLATGTISGPDPGSEGSLLELSANGTRPLTLPDDSERTFLRDGDIVTLHSPLLGEVSGDILPSF
jgi:fumarylacetoacetase